MNDEKRNISSRLPGLCELTNSSPALFLSQIKAVQMSNRPHQPNNQKPSIKVEMPNRPKQRKGRKSNSKRKGGKRPNHGSTSESLTGSAQQVDPRQQSPEVMTGSEETSVLAGPQHPPEVITGSEENPVLAGMSAHDRKLAEQEYNNAAAELLGEHPWIRGNDRLWDEEGQID
jgi:hypothetical protein